MPPTLQPAAPKHARRGPRHAWNPPARPAATTPGAPATKKSAAPLPAFARKQPVASKGGGHVPPHVQQAIDIALPTKRGGTSDGVRIKMPPPPTTLSPAAKARIVKATSATAHTAAAQASLPEADHQLHEARSAVAEPKEQADAAAAGKVVGAFQGRQPPSPQIEQLCWDIYEIIHDLRPKSDDDLVDADPDKMARRAGSKMEGSVQDGVAHVDNSYKTLDGSHAGTPVPKEGDVKPSSAAEITAPPNAAKAIPDAIPAKDVDLNADVAGSQAQIDQAGMNTAPAKLAQEGPIADARDAQGELADTAAEDPAKVLAAQNAALTKASSSMAALERSSLAMLRASRAGTTSQVHGQKNDMVGSETAMRIAAGKEAQGYFDDAHKEVSEKLKNLKTTAMELWKAGVASATTKFKKVLKNVEKLIDERHSGIGGFFLSIGDAISDLPDWVTDDYNEAERAFGDEICSSAREISSQVNTVVVACEIRIQQANDAIAGVFDRLPKSLGTWAADQKGQFQKKLTKLSDHAHEVRDDFNKELIQSATETVQDVHSQVQELREKAKGFLSRISDAIQAFLKDPVKFIINALLSILGISPASFWSLVAKIKHVIGQIADDPVQFAKNLMSAIGQGFRQFFDHFTKHLFNGFLKWLTRGLGSIGIEMPTDFSLRSMLSFMLQLMGITWPNIRARLAKLIGPKNMALVDKVLSLVMTLIELGPEGVFELVKQALNPQNILDMVINAAVSFMEMAIVKAVAEKVLLLFVPGGAILEAIEGIYKVLKWIIHNAASIFTLIETIVNGISDILAGNIAGMANAVENALAMLIPPVIDFLADLLGIGDIPEKVRDAIAGFQEKVLSFVDKALMWMIEKGKGLLAAVGIGDKKKPDKRTPEEKKAALDAALEEAVALAKKPGAKESVIRAELPLIKVKHNMVSLELVVDQQAGAKETIHFEGKINPEEPSPSVSIDAPTVEGVSISRASWDLSEGGTQHDLATRFKSDHQLDENGNVKRGTSGTYLLKAGLGRRHVVSHKDIAVHYENVLNGVPPHTKKTYEQARALLEGRGGSEARQAGRVEGPPLTNTAIHTAAKNRHYAFFNLKANLFVGDQAENSRIQQNIDPDHPDMKGVPGALTAHVAWVRSNWALDDSFQPSDKFGVLP